MRRRSTFVHDPALDIDPRQLQLAGNVLKIRELKAAREERLTVGFRELTDKRDHLEGEVEKLRRRIAEAEGEVAEETRGQGSQARHRQALKPAPAKSPASAGLFLYSVPAEKVSQSFGRPFSMPVLNQRTRCAEEPCVKDSGTT